MENNTKNLDSSPEKRKKVFEQVLAVLQMHGIAVSEKTIAYMQPFLDGSLNSDEHQRMLETLIREIGHD